LEQEVTIYEHLWDLQGKAIPRLVCWGRLDGGFLYALGTTLGGDRINVQNLAKADRM
jgi:hypothetical protein